MQFEWLRCVNGRNRAANHHLYYLMTTNIFQRAGNAIAPMLAYRSLAFEHRSADTLPPKVSCTRKKSRFECRHLVTLFVVADHHCDCAVAHGMGGVLESRSWARVRLRVGTTSPANHSNACLLYVHRSLGGQTAAVPGTRFGLVQSCHLVFGAKKAVFDEH